MNTTIMKVTPAIATKWLAENNTRNRNISIKKASQYADDMVSGNWEEETHQGLAFYNTGELADGQTRLAAVVKSGKTIRFRITHGLPLHAGAAIDRHRPRSDSDSIKIGGLANWIGQGEVSLIRMIAQAHMKAAPTFSADHIVEIGDYIKEPVQFALESFPYRKKYITTSPVMAAFAIASANFESDDDRLRLMEFADVLLSGMAQSPDDIAAIRLREWLLSGQGKGGQGVRREALHKTMRAITAFIERDQIKRLHTPDDMPYRIRGIEEYL